MARRKKKRSTVYAVSLGVHVALGLAITLIPKDKLREVIGISLGETEKPKPAPPKQEEHPHERPQHDATPSRASHSAALAAAAPAEAAPFFTDIGVSLDSSGTEGVAVAVQAPRPVVPPSEPPKAKVLSTRVTDECPEPLVKARPEHVVQPEYTLAARSSRIEGRVLIELQIDEHGEVTAARRIDGLGYGLDEAAIDAAKRAHFHPATRCGKPVAAPFVLAMRFVLGE